MAFKRSVWDEIGGLDPRYQVYCSDSDFSLRCALVGHPCYRVWWPLVPHVEHQCMADAPELDRAGLEERDAAAFLAKWGKSGAEMEAEALKRLADV
jgi:GT2 family glycosyltransferase